METKLFDLCKQIKSQHPIDIESANFICKLINDNNLKTMLEIGTGIGFSSSFFSSNSNIQKIITIEKKLGNFLFAKYYVKNYKVDYVWLDCMNFSTNDLFDIIFIDGPKSKYQQIFEKFSLNLNKKGIVVIDNIFLNRLKQKILVKTSNKYQKLINKVNSFIKWLKNNSEWNFKVINVGDGLALCERKF